MHPLRKTLEKEKTGPGRGPAEHLGRSEPGDPAQRQPKGIQAQQGAVRKRGGCFRPRLVSFSRLQAGGGYGKLRKEKNSGGETNETGMGAF